MNAFNEVARHKINTQKSLVFLYTNDEQTGKKIVPVIIAKKYTGINLSKGVKRLLQ